MRAVSGRFAHGPLEAVLGAPVQEAGISLPRRTKGLSSVQERGISSSGQDPPGLRRRDFLVLSILQAQHLAGTKHLLNIGTHESCI